MKKKEISLSLIRKLKSVKSVDSFVVENDLDPLMGIKGHSLLHLGVYAGDLAAVQAIWSYFDEMNLSLDSKNKNNETAAELASRLGFFDIYIYLKKPDIKLYRSPDPISEFFKILHENKNSVVITFISLQSSLSYKVVTRVQHYRTNGMALFSYCNRKLNLSYKVPQFSKKSPLPIFFQKVLQGTLFVFMGPKAYSWKKFNFRQHTDLSVYIKEIAPVDYARILDFCRSKNIHLVHLFTSCANSVLKKHLLKEDQSTEWLMMNNASLVKPPYAENYNDINFLPLKIKPNSVAVAGAKKIRSSLKSSFVFGGHYRILFEIKVFNWLYNKMPSLVNKQFTSNQSRFAMLSYFGTAAEIDFPTIAGKVSPSNFCKVTIGLLLRKQSFLFSLDIHESIRADHTPDEVADLIAQEMLRVVDTA